MKTFFRELEEPLIPFNLQEQFLQSTCNLQLYQELKICLVKFKFFILVINDKRKKLSEIGDLIKRMPIPHRETLRTISSHLLKVVEQSSENRMTVQNVALVFGPNIMRNNPINDAFTGFNPHIMTQNMLVEFVLVNYKDLFAFPINLICDTSCES